MKEIYREWIERAEDDIKASQILLSDKNYPPNIVCFLCEQAVEKYIKAFLTFNRIEFPYTHDIMLILEKYLLPSDETFSEIRNQISLLNEYSVKPRYPDFLESYSQKDAKEAYDSAIEMIEFIKTKFRQE